MRRLVLASCLALTLALAACGESDEEKAKNDVCDARADIQKQVNDLKDLTIGTATTDQVKSALNAMKDDVAKISDAQGNLDDSRKQQVEKANATFKSQLEKISQDLGSSQSIESAAKQLGSDLTNLASVYQQAYAPIDCG
jgi:Tfp pilus assembly protein PilP